MGVKKNSRHVCPICGSVFPTESEKQACKRNHAEICKVYGADYKQPYKNPEKYPYRIKVQFDDGNVIVFRR